MWAAIIDRQEGFLNFTPRVQAACRKTRVGVFGTGGNGTVLDQLLRVGFERFEITDFDVVEDTNLNRLPFTTAAIGRPKVEVWPEYLRSVNPSAQVIGHQRMISHKDADWVADFIDRVDIVALGTTDPEANLVISRICFEKGKRMVVGPGSSGSWVVSTFFHDDGLSMEKLGRFGTEDTPLDKIDYSSLWKKYVKLVFYPGRDEKIYPEVKKRMIADEIPARSCKIFVGLVNSAICWEMVKNVADLNGITLENTVIVKMPIMQVFDPYKGAAYYWNYETEQIGIPNWLTGEVAWQDFER